MTTLSERMRWILENRKVSARQLSLDAGLSQSHVGQIARGQLGSRIAAETLRKIAERAGVSAHWLETGEGAPDGAAPEFSEDERPRYENLPNWKRAEAEFKTATPGIPDWAYKDARATRAYAPPGPVTPAFVGQVVMHAYNIVPVEERARRALAAQDTQAKRLNTRAHNTAKRTKTPRT